MKWIETDGGRAAAGYRGDAGDCVVRSIAIASGLDYQYVYDAMNELGQMERPRKGRKRSRAREGVFVKRVGFKRWMERHGFKWTPTMRVGSGCTVHLKDGELPPGRLVVSVSRHYTCVVDGVIHDTHDPSRGGTRCVYGYWELEDEVMSEADVHRQWTKAVAGVAQGVINISEGHTTIEPDSSIHQGMKELCRLLSEHPNEVIKAIHKNDGG